MITVVCVNWCNYQGRGDEYVAKLRSMVSRHVDVPHDFVCLTEEELGTELPGWWAKVGMFRLLSGVVLYFDLDVVLSAPIVLPALNGKLWALDDFSYSLRRPDVDDPYVEGLLGGKGTVNSSVLYGDFGAMRKVWDDFTPAVMKELHGDQNWITRCLWPDKISLFQEGFARSFKYHGCGQAPITVFHGVESKPHHVPDSWVRDHWR